MVFLLHFLKTFIVVSSCLFNVLYLRDLPNVRSLRFSFMIYSIFLMSFTLSLRSMTCFWAETRKMHSLAKGREREMCILGLRDTLSKGPEGCEPGELGGGKYF